MKRVGLVGHPVAHSLSPAIQNAAFTYHRREERYELWDTEAPALKARVNDLRGGSFMGANVTVPHKQAVMQYLDCIDLLAEETGAVNTIVNKGGRLTGHNTDVAGFTQALAAGSFSAKGASTVLFGAGGAAHAVGLVLVRQEATSVDICDIDVERAKRLAERLRLIAKGSTLVRAHAPSDDALQQAVTHCWLLVNCTPLGMRHSEFEERSPVQRGLIPPGALVFDLVYNPPVTPLMSLAQAGGARTVGGLSMLVYQAAASFKLWTGLDAPVDEMASAAQKALDEYD